MFSFRGNKAKSKQIKLQFSGKFLVPHLSYISPKEKRFLVTGVNLVTEVEQPLTWFLAPVVILVLLVIASSLDKPPAPPPPHPGFTDLINVTEELTIHRPNVSTLLSSAFIRDDLNAAKRGPFMWSLISCLFFWRGVNRR